MRARHAQQTLLFSGQALPSYPRDISMERLCICLALGGVYGLSLCTPDPNSSHPDWRYESHLSQAYGLSKNLHKVSCQQPEHWGPSSDTKASGGIRSSHMRH